MKDKTRQQLMDELAELRQRIAELTATAAAGEQAKEALKASQEEPLALFDNAPVTMILVDRERRVRRVNRMAVEILGWSAAEMMDLRVGAALRCLHSLDDPRGCGFGPFCEACIVRHTVLDTFETDNAHRRVEARLSVDRGGKQEERNLLVSTSLLDVTGSQMVAVYIEDVTERQRAEEALRESEERYRSLVENSHAGILIVDDAYRFVYVNDEMCRIVGYPREELIGLDFRDLLDDASRQLVTDRYVRRQRGEQIPSRYEFHIIRKDGEERRVEISATLLRDPAGNVQTVAQLLDITERKQAEEALARERSLLRTLIDSLPDSVYIKDAQGRFVLNNAESLRRLGVVAQEELTGKMDLDFFPPEMAVQWLTDEQEIIQSGHPMVNRESAVVNKQGLRWIVSTKVPLRDQHGQIIGLVGVSHDITERKRAEETLRRRMEELAILHAITVAGAEATSLDALIELATEVIGGTLYSDNFGVELVDEAAGVLRIHPSYRGISEERKRYPLPLGQGVVGRVAATGQPWRVPDVTREPVYLELNPEMRSELCVPLKIGERVIGAINAESRRLDAFSADDERLMMTFAGQLATAIEKVRLFEAERRRAEEAETLRQAGAVVTATLQQEEAIARILQGLARVVPHDSASVQLLREGYLEIVGGRGWPDLTAVVGLRFPVPGDNPNTIVIQQRQPYILADAPAVYASFREEPHSHIRSWLGVPLIVRDQVIGMLTLAGAQPDRFTPDHARLVAAFADQVAIAIENARLFREVQQLAIIDSLTGLYNRRHFFELAQREFDRTRRYQHALSALMLDIDRFKLVNDAYGHATGDHVLRLVAERCQASLRKTDVLGRYGGEEFAIVLPDTDAARARLVAEKLRQSIARPIGTAQALVTITASLGVAPLEETCADLDGLLQRADQALYMAKRAGRDCVRVWRG